MPHRLAVVLGLGLAVLALVVPLAVAQDPSDPPQQKATSERPLVLEPDRVFRIRRCCGVDRRQVARGTRLVGRSEHARC